jgi:hypothetical protein
MTLSAREMEVYYGGETHGCVSRYGQQLECGQLIPPSNFQVRTSSSVFACVRTEDLKVVCGKATKLYTPSIISEDAAIFMGIALAFGAFLLWEKRKKAEADD